MGIHSSSRRRRQQQNMENSDGGRSTAAGQSAGSGDGENTRDLAAILSYLIRSGQVRILAGSGLDEDDDDYFDDDETDFLNPINPPKADPNPDISTMQKSQFLEETKMRSGLVNYRPGDCGITKMIHQRESGIYRCQNFSKGNQSLLGCNFLPNSMDIVDSYRQKAFCGTYSADGDVFVTACQDNNIRMYSTTHGEFKQVKGLRVLDVGWSVLDTAFSPDGRYICYSSWSEAIHLCNIYGDTEVHERLSMCPENEYSFCIFSLAFSQDNKEIMGGANDGCIYVYDRERNERTLKIDAHEDDVNAVAFADSTSHILYSGGDDGLIKAWDRRTLSEERPVAVGTMAGHMDGITFIDSRGDARYLISNCKDQTIKLWDIRMLSDKNAEEATRREVSRQNWDYRWQQVPRRVATKKEKLPGDSSLMTYRGHCVLHTLIRCRFSPEFSTGQRYIYTGCATGAVVIYDALTGQIVKKLAKHKACVRDVSWHPYDHKIISTSWDGRIGQWTYSSNPEEETGREGSQDSDSDSDSDSFGPRRSQRLRSLREQRRRMGRRVVLLD